MLSVVWLLPKVERILPWYSDIEDLNLEWYEFIKKVYEFDSVFNLEIVF